MRLRVKKVLCFVVSSVLVFGLLVLVASAAAGSTTVYVTRTGEKYHSFGCGYLRSSCIETTLSDAVSSGYEPCSKCSPPYLSSDYTAPQSSDRLDELREMSSQKAAEQDKAKQEATERSNALAEKYGTSEKVNSPSITIEQAEAQTALAVKEAVSQAELEAEIYLNGVVSDLQSKHEKEMEILESRNKDTVFISAFVCIIVSWWSYFIATARARKKAKSKIQ